MIALVALALAGPPVTEEVVVTWERPEPPPKPLGVPDPVAVDVDGEQWAALHPDLLRWRLARSAYADQLAADLSLAQGQLRAAQIDLQAVNAELAAERVMREGTERRIEDWERYAKRVERQAAMSTARDLCIVGGTVAALLAGAKLSKLAR